MSKHEELIKSLRASAAAMPFDAAVAVQYRAAADALEAQAREIEGLRKDAEELRFLESDLMYWVDRAVSKGNANSDIEDAYERYEQWLAARINGAPHG